MQPRPSAGQGNVLAITEEDYLKPGCEGQGSIQTWKITDERNPDGTIKLALVDMWTTELNELASATGRSPATVNCSAHWFDEQGGLLAQGWYDQGVRFLDISDPRDIRQTGYYATTGTFWAAYFAPTDPAHETVYALDTTSGSTCCTSTAAPGRREACVGRAGCARAWGSCTRSSRWGFACPLPRSSPSRRRGHRRRGDHQRERGEADEHGERLLRQRLLEDDRAGGDRDDVGCDAGERDHRHRRAQLQRTRGDQQRRPG